MGGEKDPIWNAGVGTQFHVPCVICKTDKVHVLHFTQNYIIFFRERNFNQKVVPYMETHREVDGKLLRGSTHLFLSP